MIIALTQNWHNLLLGWWGTKPFFSCHCQMYHYWLWARSALNNKMTSVKKSPEENVKIKQQIHTDQYPPKKSPPLQMLKRQTCMFLYFPLVQSMRNCNLFFWPLWVGQAQSGFNHKTLWPCAITEWGKLLVYLWCPYKHEHRCTAKQLSTLCYRERCAHKAAASGQGCQTERRIEKCMCLSFLLFSEMTVYLVLSVM